MTRDASLTEFGGGGGDDETETATESGADGDEAAPGATGDERRDDDAPDPVRPTSRWSAEPRPCAACGTKVQRAWTEDDRLHCPDCKDW